LGIYALGLLFEKTSGAVTPVLPPNDVLKHCFAQFTDSRFTDADDIDDIQDNAAMTIGRICKFCNSQVDCKLVYSQWLNCFPIRSDEDCSQWCYTEMVRLIAANNTVFTDDGGAIILKVIHWIADVAYTDMSNETLDKSLSDLVRKVQSNEVLMVGLKNELPSYLMEKLQRHL